MPTSFDVFYLGNLPLIDTREGDQFVSQSAVASWLGTYGSAADPLSSPDNVQQWTAGSYDGGRLPEAYDIDNSASNDTFFVDGEERTHDASMAFNATITYLDGTTADISAVLTQATNGDTYLAPEYFENADQDALEAGPIESLTLNSPIWASGRPGQGYNLVADRLIPEVPCFTPGAMIATPYGEYPVEDLKEGDLVLTRDNGKQKIRWAGRVDLTPEQLSARPEWRPVLVRAGAFGEGMPQRDLLLSPNHRMLVGGPRVALNLGETEALAAAKHLTDLPGIERVEASTISYVHLLFDRHEVILSNGAWSESFQPGDHSLAGVGEGQRDEILGLFPDLATQPGRNSYQAARRSLLRHEAALLVR